MGERDYIGTVTRENLTNISRYGEYVYSRNRKSVQKDESITLADTPGRKE